MTRSQVFLHYFFILVTNFTEPWTSNSTFMSQTLSTWTPSCRCFPTLMILHSPMEVRFNWRLSTVWQDQQRTSQKSFSQRPCKCCHKGQIQSGASIKYKVKRLQQQAGIDRGMKENCRYQNSYHIFKTLICFDFNTDCGTESRKIFY